MGVTGEVTRGEREREGSRERGITQFCREIEAIIHTALDDRSILEDKAKKFRKKHQINIFGRN